MTKEFHSSLTAMHTIPIAWRRAVYFAVVVMDLLTGKRPTKQL